MVSHEFRTPLTIIDTCAQRIIGKGAEAPTLERCESIREATRRMTRLMDEFLTLDRINGDLWHFSAQDEKTEEVVREAMAQQWSSDRIQVTYVDLPPWIHCDVVLLGVALRNLFVNALRHSLTDAAVRLRIKGYQDGTVEFAVTNTGAVIPEDEIPKLFQKYFRGRGARDKPGSGLGLYLVERIASLHNGSVTARSSDGESCITLTIDAACAR
jgi:signal transduction histidine kinase